MSRPVAGLDRTDCQILKRLNSGKEMARSTQNERIEKLLESGYVEEKSFGELMITTRGQLELARWRYRKLPKSQYAFLGPIPRNFFNGISIHRSHLFDKISIHRSHLLDRIFRPGRTAS